MSDDLEQVGDSGEFRDERGRFLPGHPYALGHGRPPGSVDFVATCRKFSRKSGVPLEEIIWAIFRGLANQAIRGDHKCAKEILDRLCGVIDKMEVNVDNRSVNMSQGPPVPKGRQFGQYLSDLRKVSEELIDEEADRKKKEQGLDDLLQ